VQCGERRVYYRWAWLRLARFVCRAVMRSSWRSGALSAALRAGPSLLLERSVAISELYRRPLRDAVRESSLRKIILCCAAVDGAAHRLSASFARAVPPRPISPSRAGAPRVGLGRRLASVWLSPYCTLTRVWGHHFVATTPDILPGTHSLTLASGPDLFYAFVARPSRLTLAATTEN